MENIDRLQPRVENQDDDLVAAQEMMRKQDAAHAEELSNAQEIAKATDPFETVIVNVKKLVETGKMTQKAAERIIENQTKRAERIARDTAEQQNLDKEHKTRYEEETQVAAGDLALHITELLSTSSSQQSFEVSDKKYKEPGSLIHKNGEISKEDIFKSSLDILGIKSEQVSGLLELINQGSKNLDPEFTSDELPDDLIFEDTSAIFGNTRVETPSGNVLITYERATYGTNTDGTHYSSPSVLRFSLDAGKYLSDSPHFDVSPSTAPSPINPALSFEMNSL